MTGRLSSCPSFCDSLCLIDIARRYSVPLFVQTIENERGEERWENNNDGQRSEKQKSFCRFFAKWIDTFLKAGEEGLKAHAGDLQEQTEKEIKELKATIGEL